MDKVVAQMIQELQDRGITKVHENWVERVPCCYAKGAQLGTIYFGGGTPSLLSLEQVERFLNCVDQQFDLSSLREVTFEANPDDINRDYLRGLKELGVNRLSLGVQSFDDDLLAFMGRRHSAGQALRAIELAREQGFNNIAVDVIYGVDGFGEQQLRRTLEQVVECGVEHVAAYHLTIEPRTRFGHMVKQGRFKCVEESVSQREFELVREYLTQGGFEHYEVSNFARDGIRSIHNSNYWSGDNYIGIGAGAHSFVDGVRCWASESLSGYIQGGDQRYEVERLTTRQRRNEAVMLSLRRVEGLDLGLFEREFGADECGELLRESRRFVDSGILVNESGRLTIPAERFLLSDMVIEALFNM